MEPWEIMISGVAGADGRRRRGPSCSTRSRRSARAGSSRARAIGEVTDTGELRASTDGERRRDPGAAPHGRGAALPVEPRAARALRRSPRPRREACSSCSARRTSAAALDLRALRPPRRLAHGAPARARRRGAPPAPVACAASPSRSTARAGGVRSTRAPAARAPSSSRRERRVRRRRAARDHGLPQLRQPGEAGDRLGARRGDRGDRARPARRSASRSSPATSRSTTRPTAGDPPDAGGRLRRARRGRPRIPGRWREGDVVSSPATRVSLDGSEYQALLGGRAAAAPHLPPRRR